MREKASWQPFRRTEEDGGQEPSELIITAHRSCHKLVQTHLLSGPVPFKRHPATIYSTFAMRFAFIYPTKYNYGEQPQVVCNLA